MASSWIGTFASTTTWLFKGESYVGNILRGRELLRPRPGDLVENTQTLLDLNDDLVPTGTRFRVVDCKHKTIKITRIGGLVDIPSFMWFDVSGFNLVIKLWVVPRHS